MRLLLIGIATSLLVSCSSGKKPDDEAFKKSLESQTSAGPGVDEEVINSILERIPSPLEISVLLKESGTKYAPEMLNSSNNLPKYNSNYKKALNLGVYGADLGYTNVFGRNSDGIKYITSIKSLADELNIGQFFDVETIGRLAANSKNLDSLLLITTMNFNHINHYLQSQSRDNLSVLLLTGGWLEAMQITCQTAAKNPGNAELREKVGEQKIVLEEILLLYSFYKDDANMAGLLADLEQLKAAYDKVEINYTYKEPTMQIVDGVAVIKDNSTTTINITPENVEEIKNVTNSIREKIIS
ncbi:MAG: hypothetical protein E6Q41_04990 [Cyclobacteriaceae bacterium]|nr:MAG: hypothetical protein E6Q41_04990 [Cyclobacteriaceae bacterium]